MSEGPKPSSKVQSPDQYQVMRDKAEKALVPLRPQASTIDGRIFEFEAPLSASLTTGSYVVLKATDSTYHIGQIITQEHGTRDGPEFEVKTDTSAGFLGLGHTNSQNLRDKIRLRFVRGSGVLLGQIDGAKFTLTGRGTPRL